MPISLQNHEHVKKWHCMKMRLNLKVSPTGSFYGKRMKLGDQITKFTKTKILRDRVMPISLLKLCHAPVQNSAA